MSKTIVSGAHELIESMKELARANARFNRLWTEYEKNLTGLLTKVRFFEMIDLLRAQIVEYRFRLGRDNGVEQACWEMYRQVWAGRPSCTADEMYRFPTTYKFVVDVIRKRYGEAFEFHGDSFSDFTDSLPLVGRVALRWTVRDDEELRNKVRRHVHGPKYPISLGDVDKWCNFINSGENYILSNLMKARKKFWVARTHSSLGEMGREMNLSFIFGE